MKNKLYFAKVLSFFTSNIFSIALFICVVVYTTNLFPQQFKMIGGSEFRVNTFSDSTQREPVVAADNNGNYVVVWTSTAQDGSEGGIYAQRFNSNDQKIGSEFKVNTTTLKNQYRPAVDMNASGRFVVVWSSIVDLASSYDIFAQIYDNNGNKVGGEILVNTYTTYSQNYADAAIDDNGNFCVVWQSWNQDGSDKGIYAQRFSADGTKLGAEFRVNTTTLYSQGRPSIDMTPTGNFVIVWESWNQDSNTPSGYGMYGQRFAADGTKLGGEFQINSYTNDYQWYGDVVVRNDGSFIVTWCSWRQDGYDGGIYFQRFNSNGEKVGNETQVNTTTAYYQWLPKIALFNNNSFVIVWSSWKQDGSREGVYGKVFNSDGVALTLEFRVNDFTNSYQWEPSVIAGNNYELLVVWSSWNQFEGKDYDVFAKRFRPDFPQGRINESSISHPSGISTAKIKVHLFDSTLTLGEQYRVNFFVKSKDSLYASIKNVARDSIRIQSFPLDRGLNQFYLTNVFDGIAVEFNPVYTLSLDVNRSNAKILSSSNLIFSYLDPTAGKKETAPIDLVLVFGKTDTSATGQYLFPLDTALGRTGVKNVICPFRAFNLRNNQKLNLLVLEGTQTTNLRWGAGEPIIVLTPPPYASGSTSTHCQINNVIPSGSNPILPYENDSVFVFTSRPLTNEDVFEFTTTKSNFVVEVKNLEELPKNFFLFQNYPNPFGEAIHSDHPSTVIKYQVGGSIERNIVGSNITLKVYDVLGRLIKTLVDEFKTAGTYKIMFDGSSLPSGVYFLRMKSGSFTEVKKMLLVR